nr:MAG TPA: hypothetical protein [Caudoviricetes sp.]
MINAVIIDSIFFFLSFCPKACYLKEPATQHTVM